VRCGRTPLPLIAEPLARSVAGSAERVPEAVLAEGVHDELHPSSLGIVEVAVADEDIDEGLGGGKDVPARDEVLERDGQRGRGA